MAGKQKRLAFDAVKWPTQPKLVTTWHPHAYLSTQTRRLLAELGLVVA